MFIVCGLTGCGTVHTGQADGLTVALWPAIPRGSSQARDTIVLVLRDAGLHPSLDDQGVFVPESEVRRALEVLLTDKRLDGTGAIVFLPVPAGSGRKTATGFEVPDVEP